MEDLSDRDLIDEIKRRCQEKQDALDALRSMTEKLEAVNKKLRESEALKSGFLSNIRNEMNNPLASILGFSEKLALEGGSPTALMIYSEAFYLDYQLRNIFAAAEIESGESSPGISNVDVARLAEDVIKSFSHRINEKGLSVDFTQKEMERLFRTDPDKLRLMFSNLIDNAIEFSHAGARIEISVLRRQGGLSVSVRDFGIGIDTDDQVLIFERFRQIDSGRTKGHKGHGLGLCVTRDFAEMMGGSVSVSSVRGEGSTFTLTLPEAAEGEGADVFSEAGNVYIFESREGFNKI